jgi:dienelactone hydrolase
MIDASGAGEVGVAAASLAAHMPAGAARSSSRSLRTVTVVVGIVAAFGCGASGADVDAGPRADADVLDARVDAETSDADVDDANTGDADDAAVTDGDVTSDAGMLPTPLCEADERRIACVRRTSVLDVDGVERAVHFQWPSTEPPAGGHPTVLLFQGSASPAGLAWVGERGGAFGAYWQADVIRALLAAGFAVVTPEASFGGAGAWNTNVAPWNVAWESSPDHALMLALFDAIDRGDLGELDPDALYAAGLSSGGYMSSRVAVAYEGRFRRLAIASGSYATCAGSFCAVPTLDTTHPPTLFLHGALDLVVPPATMRLYAEELERRGVEHEVVVDPDVDHAWIPASAERVVAFFRR